MHDITLSHIDREASKPKFWPCFSADLELLYRTETVSDQHKSVAVSFLVALFLVSTFAVCEYFLTQDYFFLYCIGRFGFMMPVCLLFTFLLYKNKAPYDFFVCAIPCWVSVVFSTILVMSEGSYRSNYLFGNILLIISGCVIGRPLLRWALISLIFQCVCYHVVLFASDIVAKNERIFSSLFCISGVIVALLTLHILEMSGRRAFLSNLRSRLLNRQLEALTLMDPLTGIGNRRFFENETQQLWDEQHGDRLASIILIDIDHFKLYNDHYGHPAGDLCLKNIAACVAGQLVGTSYQASRFGGEEFVVFLPDADMTTARQLAESIRVAIANTRIPHPVVSAHPTVSISVGVATSLVRDCSATGLVSFADMALYAAKKNGRNQVWPPVASVDDVLGNATKTARHLAA